MHVHVYIILINNYKFTRMEQNVLEHCFNNRPHIYTGG